MDCNTARTDGLIRCAPLPTPRVWFRGVDLLIGLALLSLLVLGLDAGAAWRCPSQAVDLVATVSFLGIFLWGFIASVHDWWVLRRLRPEARREEGDTHGW
jgi:hypothetical protein